MSHKKAAGSTQNGRDSVAKRLGVKVFGDQMIRAGGIILRQKGNKYFAGKNAGTGKDFTIYSLVDGRVKFSQKSLRKYDGRVFRDTIVEVVTLAA